MNTKSFFMVAIGVFVLASCNLNQVDQTGLLTASVRDALNSPATLSIADEIESVEYIPLEMTNDDASLIDGVVDFAITSKYIYVLVGKEPVSYCSIVKDTFCVHSFAKAKVPMTLMV